MFYHLDKQKKVCKQLVASFYKVEINITILKNLKPTFFFKCVYFLLTLYRAHTNTVNLRSPELRWVKYRGWLELI
jgi:hypothetical protein